MVNHSDDSDDSGELYKLNWLERVLARVVAFILMCLGFTLRMKVVGSPNIAAVDEMLATPKILVFWHGQQLCLAPTLWVLPIYFGHRKFLKNRRFNVLISRHRDGRLIAAVISHLGLKSVAGSSSRGGPMAMREMLVRLRLGENVIITPDGPRGPKEIAKSGPVQLARRTGVPIIPVAVKCNSGITFSSWDAMMLPYPFSRGVIYFGVPFTLSRDVGEEEALAELQKQMEITNELANRVIQAT